MKPLNGMGRRLHTFFSCRQKWIMFSYPLFFVRKFTDQWRVVVHNGTVWQRAVPFLCLEMGSGP